MSFDGHMFLNSTSTEILLVHIFIHLITFFLLLYFCVCFFPFRSQKPSKKKAKLSAAAAGVDEEVDPTADPFDFDETDDFGVPIPEITDPTNEGGATGDSGEVAAKKKPRR